MSTRLKVVLIADVAAFGMAMLIINYDTNHPNGKVFSDNFALSSDLILLSVALTIAALVIAFLDATKSKE